MKIASLCIAVLLLIGCAATERAATVATGVAERTGVITRDQSESIRTGIAAVTRSLEEFTPEQEYYIGRSVGAVILLRYEVLDDSRVNNYVRLVGQTLAVAADMPECFAGYHFLVLDSDEINAFATPGGHVFVTRGLLECCRSEDALAAVLAHELAHIRLRHGMQAIERARMTEALTIIAQEGLTTFGPRETARLTQVFGDVVADVANTMIRKGYSRAFEYQADAEAAAILTKVGYDPGALIDMLVIMERRIAPGGADFAATHPTPRNRIAELKKGGGFPDGDPGRDNRRERFKTALGHIL